MDALRQAVQEKHIYQVQSAFESLPEDLKGDDAWATTKDEFGETLLESAAAAGDEDVLRFLIQKLKDESLVLRQYETIFFIRFHALPSRQERRSMMTRLSFPLFLSQASWHWPS